MQNRLYLQMLPGKMRSNNVDSGTPSIPDVQSDRLRSDEFLSPGIEADRKGTVSNRF